MPFLSKLSDSKKVLLVAVGLLALAFASYLPVLSADFVRYDDNYYVFNNPKVKEGISVNSVGWAFRSTDLANWFPLTWLSHILDAQVWGLNAVGHHLSNLLLHLASTLLLMLIIWAMTGAIWRSAAVAALFALHPLHVESVAWVAERKDVLSGFFWMLSTAAYINYARKPTITRYLPVFLGLAFGLMSKPVLVTLPLTLLLLDFWPLQRMKIAPFSPPEKGEFRAASLISLITEKVPLLGLSVASSIITFHVQRQGGSMSSWPVPFMVRAGNALLSYLRYLGKTVWPRNLAVFYPYEMVKHPPVLIVGAAAVLVGVTVGFLLMVRRRPYLLIGWLWYLGTLVPMIGIVQVGTQAMADRYTYIPLIGVFIILAWGMGDLLNLSSRRVMATSVLAAVILPVLVVLTYRQASYWKNTLSLFEHAATVNPDNYLARVMVGLALQDRNRFEESNQQFLAALRLFPRLRQVHTFLGQNYYSMGDKEKAKNHFLQEISVRPSFTPPRVGLAKIFFEEGKFEEAKVQYLALLRLEPQNQTAYRALGLIAFSQEEWSDAVAYLRRALQFNPNDQFLQGKLAEARARFVKGGPKVNTR